MARPSRSRMCNALGIGGVEPVFADDAYEEGWADEPDAGDRVDDGRIGEGAPAPS